MSVNELTPNPVYEIKKGVSGLSVRYTCLHCNVRLSSPLTDAGRQDLCPDCRVPLIVPGKSEKLAEAQRQTDAKKLRDQLNAQKKAEAEEALTRKLAEEAKRARDLQLDRDPLREWLIYTVIIGILLAFAAGSHLFRALATDTSGLCAMILGLFVLGLAQNFLAIRKLRHEFVCAAFLVRKLKSRGGFAELIQAAPAGVFHQHIQDLVSIARHDPGVSQDSLITLLYSKLMAKSKIVDVLSGVLVSLGLIGTIVGLVDMTNGLSVTMESLGSSGDASQLMTGMRGTMSGLGTAFYTTLVGAILGSVVLRVLNNVYTSNVDHFVSYIASLTEVGIAPRLRKKAADTNEEALTSEVAE
jgi:Zn-finger nucleic acid-binding protein